MIKPEIYKKIKFSDVKNRPSYALTEADNSRVDSILAKLLTSFVDKHSS
jgi:hypothetical protein